MLPDTKYTDADGEEALRRAMWACGNTNNPVTRYTADAIAEKLCRETKEENPPLTLKALREMDGEPVWSEYYQTWGLISVQADGKWRNVPFFLFTKDGIRHEKNIEQRRLTLYRRKPEEGHAL